MRTIDQGLVSGVAVFAAIVAVTLAAGLLASVASVRSVFKVDPVSIFHQ